VAESDRKVANTLHVMTHPWPEDCYVQGGRRGVVIVDGGKSYRTAFVEAFPLDPNTFLRGEGTTLAEAEDDCWRQYQTYRSCIDERGAHGPFEARQYTNGAGFCVHCGTWLNNVLPVQPEDPNRKPSLLERMFSPEKAVANGALETVLQSLKETQS
jgi:hypothetical protein